MGFHQMKKQDGYLFSDSLKISFQKSDLKLPKRNCLFRIKNHTLPSHCTRDPCILCFATASVKKVESGFVRHRLTKDSMHE